MASSPIDQKNEAHNVEKTDMQDLEEKNVHLQSEILVNPELMHDAFDGENREHAMGTWEAVKTHPMACFWAFIFSFTIVSPTIRYISYLTVMPRLISPRSPGHGVVRHVPEW